MAWYETLSTFLIQNKFVKGRIDNTFFIYRSKGDVLLVQVYVDDIIFSLTSYKLCKQFEKLMTKKFEMSMMGEITYFLGLQIKQDYKGISICQEQYTRNLLKKYEISDSSLVKTPMVPPNNLCPDLASKPANETLYRGMIGSLMYLTAMMPLYASCNMDRKSTSMPVKYLEENWSVEVLRNSSQWLCPQLRLNMLLMLGVVLNGNYSSTEHINFIEQLIAYCLITGTTVDIREIIYSDLVTWLTNKSRKKYVSYPRFVSCALAELLGADYTQDEKFGSLPNVLSNSNFIKDPSKVTTIELTVSMIVVNNLESLVSPLPFSGKKKKKKSQTVSQPKPKTQGPEALGSLSQKMKKGLTKKTTPQATETPPTKKVPMEDSNKTQPGNKHPADKGLPSLVHDESIGKPKPLPKGPREDKDSERLKPLIDMESLTPPVTVLSGTDVEYETYSEVELDFEPLKLITTVDIQALFGTSNDDLKEDSEDDVSEVEEEMDEDIQEAGIEDHQTHPSTETPIEEPHSQKH
ncbi:retrovirus-related pol polyprotein from transposon TNT 1-94 [Tanacetum coccineum]